MSLTSINNITVVPLAIKTFDSTSGSWKDEISTPVRPPTDPSHQANLDRLNEEGRRLMAQQVGGNFLEPPLGGNGRKIRLATFNVLADTFPWFVEMAIQSPLRFHNLPYVLHRIQATIYGLNEVTRRSMVSIQSNPYFRQAGYSTVYFEDLAPRDDMRRHTVYNKSYDDLQQKMDRPHGCALLIKNDFEVLDAFRIHLDQASTPVGAILSLPSRPELGENDSNKILVGVVALHTTAYAKEETRQMRRRQLSDCKKVMEDMLKRTRMRLELDYAEDNDETDENDQEKKNRDIVIIMGDLNLHDVNEEKFLLDMNMLDAFAETHFVQDYASENSPSEAPVRLPLSSSDAARYKKYCVQKLYTEGTSPQDQAQFELFRRILLAVNAHERNCTFDADKNPMIPHYIPGEVRRMRLDRILIRPNCSAYFDTPTAMFGDPILNPGSGSNVCLSDHYGLYQDLVILDDVAMDASKLSEDGDDLPKPVKDSKQLKLMNNRRQLVGNEMVQKIREHFAKIPNDVTGVTPGVGVIMWKGLCFAAHPFFLLGRKFNWI